MESRKKKILKKHNKNVKKVYDLMEQPIYNRQVMNVKIRLSFKKITAFLEEEFISYAKKNIVNKCSKEGYISDNYIKVLSYSAGKMVEDGVLFDVLYEFNICYPYEGMELKCKIQNITKIGIKGILTENEEKNPIVIFASRIHNSHIIMNDENEDMEEVDNPLKKIFSEGDEIIIKIIGFRFEINDPSIYVLGQIVKDKPKIIY